MQRPSDLISICQRCLIESNKLPRNGGAFVCPEDGRNIREHAAERYCQIGKYQLGWGDWIAAVLHLVGIQEPLRRMATDIAIANATWLCDGGEFSCGCQERQQALNGIT